MPKATFMSPANESSPLRAGSMAASTASRATACIQHFGTMDQLIAMCPRCLGPLMLARCNVPDYIYGRIAEPTSAEHG
eukprot:15466812-Alexandrium_andersonii.AAC.1